MGPRRWAVLDSNRNILSNRVALWVDKSKFGCSLGANTVETMDTMDVFPPILRT